jgi:hypothetical protein
MTKPIIRIYTSVNDFVDREMTDEEFAQHELDIAELESRKAEEADKAVKKADLLSKLGITEAEAQLLLS